MSKIINIDEHKRKDDEFLTDAKKFYKPLKDCKNKEPMYEKICIECNKCKRFPKMNYTFLNKNDFKQAMKMLQIKINVGEKPLTTNKILKFKKKLKYKTGQDCEKVTMIPTELPGIYRHCAEFDDGTNMKIYIATTEEYLENLIQFAKVVKE